MVVAPAGQVGSGPPVSVSRRRGLAIALELTEQRGELVPAIGASVAAALEGRVRLLVFDNCEHVVDSVADLVEAILAASATVTILATSREGLGVSDEQLWRVPSLDVNSGTESAAVNLFVDRAHSVVSNFSLAQPGEADAVVEICRRPQVYADLARTNLAADGQGHRGDELHRILTDAQQHLQRLVNSIEGDIGVARTYGPGSPGHHLASLCARPR